jgi:hypothetical protein
MGLVDWDARQVKIRDWDGLARLGDFSDHYLQLRTARTAIKDSAPLEVKVPESV